MNRISGSGRRGRGGFLRGIGDGYSTSTGRKAGGIMSASWSLAEFRQFGKPAHT
jgi:hypothetical protein